jgi:hypothetical protein
MKTGTVERDRQYIVGSEGTIKKPGRSCTYLGPWIKVGVLGAMRFARGRDEDPVTLAKKT